MTFVKRKVDNGHPMEKENAQKSSFKRNKITMTILYYSGF